MQCKVCGSRNQTEFNAEINVHFPGLKNVDKPAVLVFPKLLLCLDCGFTEFTLSETELHLLDETRLSEMQGLQKRRN
jgi:hypothetical protein